MESKQPSPLEQHLRNLETGEKESAGQSFSVSFQKLGCRYRTFQEKSEAYYLLRLLQGLIRSGASEISIKTTRSTILLEVPSFSNGPPDWLSPTVLAQRLTQPQLWKRALHAVCAGILCTCTENFQELIWSYGGEILAGSAVSSHDYRVLEGDPSRKSLEILIKKTRGYILSSTTVEHAELATRLGASPVPITLDSRRITLPKPQLTHVEDDWYKEFTAPLLLAEMEGGARPPEDWDGDFGIPATPGGWAALKWYCDPEGPYFRTALSVKLEGTGVICPIIDGVMGKSVQIARLPATISYIDGQDLETDLSGLALVEPTPLVECIFQWYDPLLDKILKHREQIHSTWDTNFPSYPVSSSLGADPISLVAILPVAVGCMALEASTSRVLFELRRDTFSRKLRSALAERLKKVIEQRRVYSA